MDLKFKIVLIVIISFIANAAAQDTKQKDSILVEPPYTQDLSEFQDKKYYNARSQKLLACWLYLKQQQQGNNADASSISEQSWLHLIKRCMASISRKNSVLKITELGNRNFQPVQPFQNILNIQQQIKMVKTDRQIDEFDKFLLLRSQQFSKQLKQILNKGNVGAQIDDQIKKRQKYYFGFIPSSIVNHTTILITVTTIMMFCCTCCRLFRASSKAIAQKQRKNRTMQQQDKQQIAIVNTKSSISRKINKKIK